MKKYNIWFLIIMCLGITIQNSFGYNNIRRFGGTPSRPSNGNQKSEYKNGPYHNPYKYNNPETDAYYADEYKRLQEKQAMEYNLSNLSYEEKRFAKMMGISLSSNEEIEKFKITLNDLSSIHETASSSSNVLENNFCLNLLGTNTVHSFQNICTTYKFYYKDSLEKNENKEVDNVMFSFNFYKIFYNSNIKTDFSYEYQILYRENIIKFHQWLILINSKMNEFINISKSKNISTFSIISKEYNIKNDFSIVYVKNINKEYISSKIMFLNARFKVFSDRNGIYYISEFYDNDSREVIFSCDLNGLKNLVKITNIKIADKKIKLKKIKKDI